MGGLEVAGHVDVVASPLHELVGLGAQPLEAVLAVHVADPAAGLGSVLNISSDWVSDCSAIAANVAHVVLEAPLLARAQAPPQQQ